jgi:hypothetical protein
MARTVQVGECLGGETPDYPKSSIVSKVPASAWGQVPGFTNNLNKYSENSERKSSPVTCFARPSPAVNERRMSRIAKGPLDPNSGTLFKEQALAHDSQTVSAGRHVMQNSVDIDSRHSRAIVKEIGERLRGSLERGSLEEDRELPVNLRKQIERLRQSESEAQAISNAMLALGGGRNDHIG